MGAANTYRYVNTTNAYNAGVNSAYLREGASWTQGASKTSTRTGLTVGRYYVLFSMCFLSNSNESIDNHITFTNITKVSTWYRTQTFDGKYYTAYCVLFKPTQTTISITNANMYASSSCYLFSIG